MISLKEINTYQKIFCGIIAIFAVNSVNFWGFNGLAGAWIILAGIHFFKTQFSIQRLGRSALQLIKRVLFFLVSIAGVGLVNVYSYDLNLNLFLPSYIVFSLAGLYFLKKK